MSVADPRQAWDQSQMTALQSLVGKRIAAARVREMGLYGPEEDPAFTHPDMDFVQASRLQLILEDGTSFEISTWQDDDQFALRVEHVAVPQDIGPRLGDTLFRVRELGDFPRGEVQDAKYSQDERGDIQEIILTIGGAGAILRAGEVYENADDTLTIWERDESVLIFLDENAYARTVFNKPVYRQR